MNILFYLKPKSEIDFLYDDFTVRQALEKMSSKGFTMVPVIERKTGRYLRSLLQGDFLDYLTEHRLSFADLEILPISDIASSRVIKPVRVTCDVSELYKIIIDENYVPVVDDNGIFIGIVTRRSVMGELFKEATDSGK
jgi:CBS domain-containing protein